MNASAKRDRRALVPYERPTIALRARIQLPPSLPLVRRPRRLSSGSQRGPNSFPVPTYWLFKRNKRLGENDVITKIAGYAGKDAKKDSALWSSQKVWTSLDTIRSCQILPKSDWERVCTWSLGHVAHSFLTFFQRFLS